MAGKWRRFLLGNASHGKVLLAPLNAPIGTEHAAVQYAIIHMILLLWGPASVNQKTFISWLQQGCLPQGTPQIRH